MANVLEPLTSRTEVQDAVARIDVDSSSSLVKVLSARLAASSPDSSVVGFYDRASKSTKELNQVDFLRQSLSLSKYLKKDGVSAGDYVPIIGSSPKSTLLMFFAAGFAGAVPTILPVRPAFDDSASIDMRARATQKILGTQTHFLIESSVTNKVNNIASFARVTTVLDTDGARDQGEFDRSEIPHGPLSHVQLTSATTGDSKGVVISNASLLANLAAIKARAQISQYDVIVSWLPLYHDMGLVGQALLAFIYGLDLHLLSPFDFLADPVAWLHVISDKRGTITASPTFGFDVVTRRVRPKEISTLDLTSLKNATCGAEPVDATVLKAFDAKFSAAGLSGRALTPSYGLAEATLAVTAVASNEKWKSLSLDSSLLRDLKEIPLKIPTSLENSIGAGELVSVGRAVDGLTIEIVDDNSEPKGDLVCGEIVVRGTSVSPGYIDNGGQISGLDGGCLRTGDVGFVYQGQLFVIDRIKDIVIRNGENFSTSLIEQSLARATGLSSDAVFVFDRDIARGAELTAVIELDRRSESTRTLQQISLVAHQCEPPLDSVVFVKRGSLPRTTSGKKRHAEARRRLLDKELRVIASYDVRSMRHAMRSQVLEAEKKDERQVLELVATDVRTRGLDVPVTLLSSLHYDLDFDSFGLIDLIESCNQTFDIDISQEGIRSLRSVADLLELVRSSRSSASFVVPEQAQPIENDLMMDRPTERFSAKRRGSVVAVLIAISVGWTVCGFLFGPKIDFSGARAAQFGGALLASESLFIVGALLMAASIGRQFNTTRDLLRALRNLRSEAKDLVHIASLSRSFGFGFWMNFAGAVGSTVVVLAGTMLYAPVPGVLLIAVLFMDLLSTFAWRITVHRARRRRFKRSRIFVRQATNEDIQKYHALQVLRWSMDNAATIEQLRSRLRSYEKGMLVAENGSGIVGMAYAVRISDYDFEQPPSWYEVTANGFCTNADPTGDVLYGVDLSTSPTVGAEAGDALLINLAALSVREGVRFAMLGGRLPDYNRYASAMDANEYVQALNAEGKLLDRQLRFYTDIPGLKLIKALPNYFNDPESLDYGVLLCWRNPFYGLPGRRLFALLIPVMFRLEAALQLLNTRRQRKI